MYRHVQTCRADPHNPVREDNKPKNKKDVEINVFSLFKKYRSKSCLAWNLKSYLKLSILHETISLQQRVTLLKHNVIVTCSKKAVSYSNHVTDLRSKCNWKIPNLGTDSRILFICKTLQIRNMHITTISLDKQNTEFVIYRTQIPYRYLCYHTVYL